MKLTSASNVDGNPGGARYLKVLLDAGPACGGVLCGRVVNKGLSLALGSALQGYLAHKKHPPRRTLQ